MHYSRLFLTRHVMIFSVLITFNLSTSTRAQELTPSAEVKAQPVPQAKKVKKTPAQAQAPKAQAQAPKAQAQAPQAPKAQAPKAQAPQAPKAQAPQAQAKVQAKAQAKPQAIPTRIKDAIAQVGTRALTLTQVDAQIAAELKQIRLEYEQKLYEIRSQAIDRFLSEGAVELQVAASPANSIPELFESEALTQVAEVSDADAQAFYNENKERIGDTPQTEVLPMIKNYLKQQKQQEAIRTYVMKLRRAHHARNFLQPPRVKVEAVGFSKGAKDAPITIVEFADYECGYCSRVLGSVDEVMRRYAGKVRLVFRDFPLSFHPNAVPAAIAARCAGAQGKFWEMHKTLFQHQSELTADNFKTWAGELGLNLEAFAKCSADPATQAAIDADTKAGAKVGVSGTPAFFINGLSLSGAQPLEAFVSAIDAELERLNANK